MILSIGTLFAIKVVIELLKLLEQSGGGQSISRHCQKTPIRYYLHDNLSFLETQGFDHELEGIPRMITAEKNIQNQKQI